MTKHILACFFLLLSATGFAQINFESGYFIDNNGNKTTCLIKNIAWKDSPVNFEYKLSESGEAKIATINEVAEFNVSSYKFKRFNVKIERSSNHASKMDTKRDIVWRDETLYLKVLVEGNAALYQYEGENLIKYFYSTGSHDTAEQLLFKEFVVDTRINTVSHYRQQLYNLMKDKMPSSNYFKKIKYKKDDLVEVFNEYNAAKGSSATDYTEGQNKSAFHLKITPGVNFASLETENPFIPKADNEFGTKTTFRIGLEIEYIMPFNNKKWALFLDPNYSLYKNETVNNGAKMTVEFNAFEVPVGARHYFFLNDNSTIFINAMAVFKFGMGKSFIQYDTQEPLKIRNTTNYAVGAGYSFNRFSLEARYNLPHDILKDYPAWLAEQKGFAIIFGYQFL